MVARGVRIVNHGKRSGHFAALAMIRVESSNSNAASLNNGFQLIEENKFGIL